MTNRIPVWFQGVALIVLWWIVLVIEYWASDSLSHNRIFLPLGMTLALIFLSLRFGWAFIATRRKKSTVELVVFALAIVVSVTGVLITFDDLRPEILDKIARQFR